MQYPGYQALYTLGRVMWTHRAHHPTPAQHPCCALYLSGIICSEASALPQPNGQLHSLLMLSHYPVQLCLGLVSIGIILLMYLFIYSLSPSSGCELPEAETPLSALLFPRPRAQVGTSRCSDQLTGCQPFVESRN